MNELNRLIRYYEQENPRKKARMNIVGDGSIWYDGFVGWLVETYTNSFKHMESQIKSLESRPTCGLEQRKFLDEVEKGKVVSPNLVYLGGEYDGVSQLWQEHFTADLQKVIKGE